MLFEDVVKDIDFRCSDAGFLESFTKNICLWPYQAGDARGFLSVVSLGRPQLPFFRFSVSCLAAAGELSCVDCLKVPFLN